MRPSPRLLAATLCLALGTGRLLSHAAEDTPPADKSPETVLRIPAEKMAGYHAPDARATVYEVPIEGVIDLGLAPLVERVAKQAEPGAVIVLNIKTDGGRVDAAVRMREALLDARVPVVAYIDRRAISAGALIALAANTIIMSPGASFGDAMPVQAGSGGEMQATTEKVVSYMRSIMRATAEARGRRGDLAEAMVDPDIALEGIIEKGKLLTLASDRALELDMAEAIAPSYERALALLNLQSGQRVRVTANWGEQVARWLTHPAVTSLLMTFGFLGILMELYTPGFGITGAIGAACLFLFFFGQYAANLAGAEEIILFAVGLLLLGLELFVIPGFGVAGVGGIIAIGVAMVMAMMELNLPLDVSFDLGYAQEAIFAAASRLSLTLIAVAVASFFLVKYMPSSRFGSTLILRTATNASQGYVSPIASGTSDLLGKAGVASSNLRPQGSADIDGKSYDVTSTDGLIGKGEAIEVARVEGARILVKRKTA